MDGATIAFALSPQTDGIDRGEPGYIVLVDEDGSYKSIETAGMDAAEIDWRGDTLFASDATNDYWIGATSSSSVASPKPNLQEALFWDGGNGQYIGLYNQGFTNDGGYREQVVSSSTTQAQSNDVEGSYWVTAQCEDRILGVAPRSGPYLSGDDRAQFEAGTAPAGDMLAQIYPLPEGRESVIGTADTGDTTVPYGRGHCAAGMLSYLAFIDGIGPSGLTGPVLRTWDTANGSVKDFQLSNATGEALPLSADDVGFATQLPEVKEDTLVWIDRRGAVNQTTIATGQTETILNLPVESDASLLAHVDSQGTIHVLEQSPSSGELTLHTVDLEDATVKDTIVVSELGKQTGIDMVLRDFAVRPE